ncbi:MAG: MBL fold metallo-hydrolase [Acetobacteraceae bacterium]|nr:MBL fold metallo-hydrolase [Acetobacteraceae bacterium]
MDFLTEPEPPRGIASAVAAGVRRLVARNPGPMTYRGTNTYLLDQPDGIAVLDPGPDDPEHVADLLREAAGPIRRILLSHTHRDHLGAVAALRAATGAPVHAYARPAVPGFVPDVALEDGDEAAGLVALHTPGHAADHLCFAVPDGTLYSADHVMSWSSSVVVPPGGDMAAYMRELERLLARDDQLYLPGHGPAIADPIPFVRGLLAHRRAREAAILAALGDVPRPVQDLVGLLYADLDPRLRAVAERNVAAHLLKLAAEGSAVEDGQGWRRA